MTSRITINTDDPAKAEEIVVLEKLQKIYSGTDTYLKDFFTDKLVGWVSQQIKNDFPPDLYDWGFGVSQPLKEEIEDLKNTIEFWKKETEGLAANVKIQSERSDALTGTVAQLYEDKSDLEDIIDKKADAIDALEMEVVALKAKLYDLIAKES